MICEHPKSDVVNAYRPARARLRLGKYERYLVERLAVRVERLLGKHDACEPARGDPGDVQKRGGRRGEFVSRPRARARARHWLGLPSLPIDGIERLNPWVEAAVRPAGGPRFVVSAASSPSDYPISSSD